MVRGANHWISKAAGMKSLDEKKNPHCLSCLLRSCSVVDSAAIRVPGQGLASPGSATCTAFPSGARV